MESMQAEMPIEMIETERGPSLEDQIEMKKKHLSDAKREWSNALALFKDVFGVGIEFYKPKMFEGQVVEKFKEAIQEKKRYWEADLS